MSAYLCSAAHLSLLVTAARGARVHNPQQYLAPSAVASIGVVQSEEDALFNMLAETNMESLGARYDNIKDWTSDAQSFVFTPTKRLPKFIAIIKSIHCYRYQSCEHDGWVGSPAEQFTRDLEDSLIRELPGYEDAPWGI